ncbi:MAG: hypothetical protein HOO91_05005 [Bacteroidales bacterium]|nr:hypothetical protein [Bacteroidales bacterium]
MEPVFENINEVLIKEINKAEFIILAAVAWITDYKIIEALIGRLKEGISVELVINGDDRFEKSKNQFDEFRSYGGRLFLYQNDNKSIMHNKFCTIDLVTSITGSFNWSFSASNYHKENIVIERDNINSGRLFSQEFSKLKRSSILYEGKINHYDIGDYAKVISLISNSEDGIIEVQVKSGNKFGFVYFIPEFLFSNLPNPEKLFGYWNEKIVDINNEEILASGLSMYEFECIDPRYLKYIMTTSKL